MFSNPVYITFALYLVVVLGIGFMAYFATRNFDDYILGGRSLGSFVTAMSAGASDMSGWLLMGLPSAIYLSGLSQSWIAIGLVIGAYFNWLLVAGRLRVFTEFNANALTLPEYFFHRFGANNRLMKIATAGIILFFFTIYCAAGVVAGARLFESLFELDYVTALWLGAGATIVYTFIGGFLAVSWTDTIQASLMIFALIFAPVMVYLNLGGMTEIHAALAMASQTKGIEYDSLVFGTSLVGIVSAAAWGLGYFGQPHILARFMAAQSVKSLNTARRIGMTWMVLCLGGAVAVGYFGLAYFTTHPELIATMADKTGRIDSERIFIELSKLLFNPWVAGVVLSAILAATMSTLSCQLLVCSSAITEDLYKGFIRPNANQKELVWVGRCMVLFIAIIAIVIAYNPNSKVLGLVSNAWAGFGASFGPVVLLSLFWQKTTAQGALAGMIVGALTVVVWKPLTGSELYEMIPGFILAMLAIYVVSLFTKNSAAVEACFAKADKAYQQAK
ncbi:sodium/proline symporter [Moraxella macacae 0408225]|uniref:Sodium/proline symporter n=1 Tax=Moraxella macacae 0408225 TaxID=1230338 RepID=L2F6W0_9GAMM|nr:sodium/proline symporter PutP [Moraxella macacae]ELA08521.1 sodium/proline symporter [Moraxella macacae 0408225]